MREYAFRVFTPTEEDQSATTTSLAAALKSLTQRERGARQTLETANADPQVILHGNYKLREIYGEPHPPDLHEGPDTPLRLEALAALLEQFVPPPRPPIEGVLTPDELDARTTLSKARANMQLVKSGNVKILELNARAARRPAVAKTFGSGFIGW